MCDINISADMIKNGLSGVIGAIIGGLISGLATLWATKNAYKNQQKEKKNDEELHVKAFCKSILSELEFVWQRYLISAGNSLMNLSAGTPMSSPYIVGEGYFAIFDNNSQMLGHILDTDLRNSIVNAYIGLRGLVDSYRMNNTLLERTKNSNYLNQGVQQDLLAYAIHLKKEHMALKVTIDSTLVKIKQFLIS